MTRDWMAEMRELRDPEPAPVLPEMARPARPRRGPGALILLVGWLVLMLALLLVDVWLVGLLMGAWS